MQRTTMNQLYDTLKKVYDITSGPWDDPVISEELYLEIEATLKRYENIPVDGKDD